MFWIADWLPLPMVPKASDTGLRASAGGLAFTVRFTDAVPAVPAGVGVALRVPEYVPGAVAVTTVTVPQLTAPPAHDAGPLRVVPLGDEYAMDVAAVCPVFPSVQVIVAAVGDVVGDVLLQAVNVSAGGVAETVSATLADAAVPAGVGVAVKVPE